MLSEVLPGRRMHDVLFGAESGWTPSFVAVAAALALTFWIWRRLRRAPHVVRA